MNLRNYVLPAAVSRNFLESYFEQNVMEWKEIKSVELH